MRGSKRSAAKRTALLCRAAILTLLFSARCVWQIERRTWKLDLIAAVKKRIHAAPVAAPPPGGWAKVTAARDEYRRVFADGWLLNDDRPPAGDRSRCALFIDADATPNPRGWPLGGLLVVAFPNNHFVHAITWFLLTPLAQAGS